MAYAQPGYSMRAARPVVLAPVIPIRPPKTILKPPSMQWPKVLLLTVATLGIFGAFWAILQANFIKKISPRYNGRGLLTLIFAISVGYLGGLAIALAITPHDGYLHGYDMRMLIPIASLLTAFVLCVLTVACILEMRRGLLEYYGSAPVQLQLDVAMTLLFNIFYFQYHLQRIAQVKSGYLAR